MIIKTASGKWLMGWMSKGGFTGTYTLTKAWERAEKLKISGCSWYSLGSLMASQLLHAKAVELALLRLSYLSRAH